MTPEAAQRAALQEDGGPNPRTIVDAKKLDIKNSALNLHPPGSRVLSLSFSHLITPLNVPGEFIMKRLSRR
jgi:hypothetical protein